MSDTSRTVAIPSVYAPEPLTSQLREVVARIRALKAVVESLGELQKQHKASTRKTLRELQSDLSAFSSFTDARQEDLEVFSASIREIHRTRQDATLNMFLLELRRNEIENQIAEYVNRVQAEEYPLPSYDGTTLGKASYIGEASSGTREWHEMRQGGIGGSQVLDAAGFSDKGCLTTLSTSAQIYTSQEVLSEKTDSPDALVQGVNEAAERGNLWEPVLLDIYRRVTGADVRIGKQTWRGSREWQVINVDGIIVDANGEPEGLVECKNSNSDSTWVGGVPLKYRAQLLYYLDATGLEYGDIIYRVNGLVKVDRLYRGEQIDKCPCTDGTHGYTIEDIITPIEELWEKVKSVQSYERGKHWYWKSGRMDEPDLNKYEIGRANSNVWALLHYAFTRKEVSDALSSLRSEGLTLMESVKYLLLEHFDRDRLGNMVGIDGETASIVGDVPHRPFSPLYSDWIESGVALYGSDGRIITHHRRHGADKRILDVNGTGAEHVHQIRRDEIEGLPRFIDDWKWMHSFLKDADVIVSHNVEFEKKHLSPIMFDVTERKPWLDTQWLVKYFVPAQKVTDRNTLKDFVENMGGEYKNAHRAYVDARMMMEALSVLLDRFPDF